ncbi:MAG: metallophosphoesterase family protein [Candidatus Deferrimicrobiaceae bacterium]
MKKLLVLSDIHANYPALKAIEDHVDPDRFDRIVNAGDLTVYSTFPNETIEWFRRRTTSVCIAGNTDKRVLAILEGKPLEKPRKEEKRAMYYWTGETLLPENREYLKSLPEEAVVTMEGLRIRIIHGDFDEEEENSSSLGNPESRFRTLARESRCQAYILGHTHIPFHTIVDGVHFINPGSVGRPFDGDPRSSFAILTVSSGKITVEHFRIPYSVEEVITGLKNNRLPDSYGKMYRTGRKLN